MSTENTNHHHHHHHHHRLDSATKFKQDSLKAIRRRKLFEKWGKIVLAIIAVIMLALVALLPA